jgi:hypothetical protein
MALTGWQAQVETGFTAVENQWGEQANLLPWSSTRTRFTEAGPDSTRPSVLDVTILFKQKNASVSNQGADDSQAVKQELYCIIKTTYIQQCILQPGDRIELLHPSRNGMVVEVAYMTKPFLTRQKVYVTRTTEQPL